MLSDHEISGPREIRLNFRELSGRFDLVDGDGNDTGADWYLNAGLRWLDDQLPTDFGLTRYPTVLAEGAFYVNIPRCRAIRDMWVFDHTGGDRLPFDRKSIAWMRGNYPNKWSDSGETERSQPRYWCPMPVRLAPSLRGLTSLSGYYDVEDIQLGNTLETHVYQSVVFLPPADGAYTLTVLGAFYSPRLDSDGMSFWLAMHPDALVLAGLMKLEQFRRNTEGAGDYRRALEDTIQAIDYNAVEAEWATYNKIDLYREDTTV